MGRKKNKVKDTRPFSERHPKLNALYGLVILVGLCYGGYRCIDWFFGICKSALDYLGTLASKLDAVVIVALITGAVSLTGVIISSVVAKIIDYKKSRHEYLAQKREEPYGQFVNMVYKIQRLGKDPGSYTQEEMIEEISQFSKGITLWGSAKVANKWVKFRENGQKPEEAYKNLFLMEDIMNAMRKDLGLPKVKKGNLLAFFVNDIKTAMKK